MSMKQFSNKLKKWSRTQETTVKNAVRKAGEKVREVSIRDHLSGPKMPKGKGSDTHATLQPQSGDLKNSVNVQVKKQQNIKGTIGTPKKYGRVHEYGYPQKGIPARPYLSSSLEDQREEIQETILSDLITSYRRS